MEAVPDAFVGRWQGTISGTTQRDVGSAALTRSQGRSSAVLLGAPDRLGLLPGGAAIRDEAVAETA
ncbi:hypothetical protein ACFQ07_21365, partial [Actinomadura adrarensis]